MSECPVCLEEESSRCVTLKCHYSHKLCLECAMKMIKCDHIPPRIKCPICRCTTTLCVSLSDEESDYIVYNLHPFHVSAEHFNQLAIQSQQNNTFRGWERVLTDMAYRPLFCLYQLNEPITYDVTYKFLEQKRKLVFPSVDAIMGLKLTHLDNVSYVRISLQSKDRRYKHVLLSVYVKDTDIINNELIVVPKCNSIIITSKCKISKCIQFLHPGLYMMIELSPGGVCNVEATACMISDSCIRQRFHYWNGILEPFEYRRFDSIHELSTENPRCNVM
jgi:hypothetical protein